MLGKKSKFRIIISEQTSSIENMATDEALLTSYTNNDSAILRLYTWDKDSLTIGVSQDLDTYSFLNNKKGKIAKRITGGGILFHGHDLSYSLIIPTYLLESLNIKESYESICSFILKFYEKLGLNVCYAKDSQKIKLSKSEYCQVGFEAYDILVNNKKIGGNAQRRTKKAIFQHGSIPIFKTKKDEKFGNSLEDIDVNIKFEDAIKLLIESFKDTFNVEIEYSQLNEKEKNTKDLLLKDKYDYARK